MDENKVFGESITIRQQVILHQQVKLKTKESSEEVLLTGALKH